MTGKKSLSIRLPESLAEELKTKAAEEGVSVTEMINRFARLGLRFAAEDRLPFVGLPETNGNGHRDRDSYLNGRVQEPSTEYALSTQKLMETEEPVINDDLDAPTAPDEPPLTAAANTPDDLLNGFDRFSKTLQSSMRHLTDERNRDRVVETIGELAKLKTRIQLDPWVLQNLSKE